jgi:hypothetical protein
MIIAVGFTENQFKLTGPLYKKYLVLKNGKKKVAHAIIKVKAAVPLQAWSGPEGSRKLRFPDFMTTAQDSG